MPFVYLSPDAHPSQLFIKLYPDQLQSSHAVEALVQAVWALVGSNKLPSLADDGVSPLSSFSPLSN